MPTWTPPPLPAGWAATVQPHLVGRRRELAVLEEAWSAVTAGARQVVFVGGEPGAGKSRLLAEAATVLHGQGATVLVGSCIEELGSPYQPFVEPIEALLPAFAGAEAGSPGALPVEEQRVVDRLMTVAGRGGARRDASEPEYQRKLYDAAVETFRVIATQTPLVLALEDLHLAGESSLALLTYAVERTAESRILVLATHRTTAADRSDRLVHAIAQLYRLHGVRRLDLSGLDTEDITDYLCRETGAPRHRTRAGAAVLRDQTGGNAFFLRELWRDLAVRGGLNALRAGSFSAPESVRDMLASRLDRVTAPHRRILELAAVVGDDFDGMTVHAASGTTPEETLAAIDTAITLGLLEPAPGLDGVFRFPHALARQAVLDLMTSSSRARDHARVAQLLEASESDPEHRIPRLAHHYASAQALGCTARAVHYLVAAADLADRSLAHLDAAGLCERAARLTEDPGHRDELLLAAARSHLLGGGFARARELYERVATGGAPSSRLRAAIGYEIASWRTGRAGPRTVELLSDSMAAGQPDPSDPTYIRALASLGRARAYTGAVDEGEQLCRQAIQLARRVGDDDLLADALEAGMGYGLLPPSAQRQLDWGTELARLAEESGDMSHLATAAYNRSVLSYLRGEPDSLEKSHAELVRAARATGQVFWDYAAGCIDYGKQFSAGDFATAEQTCVALLELGDSFGTDGGEGPYGVQAFMIRRETGALEPVRALVTGDERPTDHWAPGLLALYTELGLTDPTARLLRWVLDEALPTYTSSARWPGVLAFLAEAALWLEDVPAARRLRPLLTEYAGHNLMLGGFDALFGSGDRYLGSLDSMLDRGCPEDCFQAAWEMDTRMGSRVHEAHTLAAHVVHLRRRGSDGKRADELAARARSIAEPIGLARVLRMLAAPGSGAGRSARSDGLTARETEVLRLLGEGLSNRGIGARLVISENTAANHVRSILVKTGCANRTQAAMYGRGLSG